MRLLEITNDFPPTLGGIENYIYSLLARWHPSEIKVLTRWVPGCEEFDKGLDFEVVRIPVGTLLPDIRTWNQAKKLTRSFRPQMVHFASSLPLGLLGPRLQKAFGIPYSISVHGGEFMLSSRLPVAKSALRRVVGGASVVLAQSSFSQKIVEEFFEVPPPIRRVTCGVDLYRIDNASPSPDVPKDGPVVLSVSRLVARKGPATLIRAMPSVLEDHPSTIAVIVGGGPDERRLKALANELFVNDSVLFVGPVAWEEIPQWYAAADIFALPTRERFGGIETEGLPLVYVEAAAASLPLIGGKAGGVSDAVRHEETGLLVDGTDPDETADAINRLISNPAEAARMGTAARKMAESEFGWDFIFGVFEDALTEAAAP